MVYPADILVYSKAQQQHFQHVRLVPEKQRQENFYANLSSCSFGAGFVEYLSHHLTSDGDIADPQKVNVIGDWPTLKTKAEVQLFLGFVSYYTKLIRKCSKSAKPLTVLTSIVLFKWTNEHTAAFEKLQNDICSAPVLKPFDLTLPTFITTDASKYAIGAVVEQLEDEQAHSVSFLSRTLNGSE